MTSFLLTILVCGTFAALGFVLGSRISSTMWKNIIAYHFMSEGADDEFIVDLLGNLSKHAKHGRLYDPQKGKKK